MLNILTEPAPSPQSFYAAKDTIISYIAGRYVRYCVGECEINEQRTIDCLTKSWQALRAIKDPSPFKTVATFTAFFIDSKPIKTLLPRIPFRDMADKQNAVSAFFISVDFLLDAKLYTKDGLKVLSNKIEVSDHFYEDVIGALSEISLRDIPLVSLMYEALSYQANPKASYLDSLHNTMRYLCGPRHY